MNKISIFCKSYRGDLERAAVLAESVQKYNRDNLLFYIAVPQDDLSLFKDRIGEGGVNWLCDEDVIGANPSINLNAYRMMPGMISQQIVKAEFWRLNPCENYLCVDSDSRFIREFFARDFLTEDGTPYTVLHEGKPFLEFCFINRIQEVNQSFEATSEAMRKRFRRTGPSYNFGPFPVVWSGEVWRALLLDLNADGKNILDAIVEHPHEASWYGEAMLKYQPISLLPREPFFKAYLYMEEYEHDRSLGIDEAVLARFYSGVVYQSNWYPKRLQIMKRWAYKMKRQLKNFRKL